VSSFFYSKDIIYALYESHIEVSAKVFSILILGFVPISISYIFGTLLTANGSLRALNFMALAGFLTNIILNCILIPKYQAYGAAIASLVTQVVTAIIQMILAVRILKFNVTRKFIFLTISYTFLIFISAYLINNYVENRMLGFSAIILFSIVLAGLFKLINIKFLYKIIKYDL
jgi:O-antigen/teichoic acid export membrane protein